MRKVIVLIFLFVSVFGFSQNQELFDKANASYQNGEFEASISSYEKIIENGEASAEVYYNLGNAHYKLNNVAPSIYYFEKALQLQPKDEDIQNNIEFTRNMAIDDIDEYLEAQRKKRKKRKIILGVLVGAAIIIIGVTTLIATKGITYVMDTYIGHPTKELLEGEWIRSEYGNPTVAVTTPKVLVRGEIEMPEDVQRMMVGSETFVYGSLLSNFYSAVTTIKFRGEVQFDPP